MADMLCTIAQVKARVFPAGITDTADDALFTELVEQVSGWIQTYTGRKLVPDNAATWTFDTAYGNVLRIPRGIRSITSMGVAQTPQPDTGGTYTTVTAADRLLRPLAVDLPEGWPPTEVRLTRGTLAGTVRTFADADNGCTITGNFGWAVTPVDVAAVCIEGVVAAYAVRKGGPVDVLGGEGSTFPGWTPTWPQRMTLDRYRYWTV